MLKSSRAIFVGSTFATVLLLNSTGNVELSAQEYAVVTSEFGYVTNDKDEVQSRLPHFSLVEFSDVKDGKLILKRFDGKYGIRLGQIFAILELSEVGRPFSVAEQQVMLNALVTLRDAFELAKKEQYSKAIKKGEKADTELGVLFSSDPAPSPYQVWFQSHIAYFEYAAGKLNAANKRLKQAEAMLARVKVKDPVQAADLYNVRGLVRMEEGNLNEAIPLFERSLAVAEQTLGKTHINRAAYFSNVSFAHEGLGQAQKALDSQTEAMKLILTLLPDSAIEVARGYSRLADLYLAMEKPKQALAAYEYAFRSFNAADHLKEFPADMANARLGMSDALALMGKFDLAKQALEVGMSIELIAMRGTEELDFKKAFLYRLGVLEYEQEKYDDSMPHFEKARELYDRKTEKSIDADIMATIGHVHSYNNRKAKARKAYQQALEIYTRIEGKDSSNARESRQWIAELDE